jgi:hypothetical protein
MNATVAALPARVKITLSASGDIMAKTQRTIDEKITRLRTYNVVAGSLHLLQAVGLGYVLTLLDNQVTFPVTADYLGGPPGVPVPAERVELFDINVGIGVVAFLAMSAFFHYLISSPMFFTRYGNGLKKNRNYFRWTEYSLSSSVMIWLVAQITGITDIAALFGIFAVNASMIMFGALQEKYESPGSGGFPPVCLRFDDRDCSLDCYPHLLLCAGVRGDGGSARVCDRHHHLAVPVLQHLCGEPGASVPPRWRLG